jgi:DNA-binding NarL/FixJ family response regulator
MAGGIRICIAEDNGSIKRYFTDIFMHETDISLEGMASSGKEILDLVRTIDCDVLLMDVEMDERRDGLDAAKLIHAQHPDIKIIMLTIHEDIDTILEAFEAGAVDFIVKDSSASTIIKAVRDAYADRSSLEPTISEKLRTNITLVKKKMDNINRIIRILSSVTKTERVILSCILQNMSLREMADSNFIEIATVKYHISNILKKFEVNRRKDIIRMIHDLGMDDVVKNFSEQVK